MNDPIQTSRREMKDLIQASRREMNDLIQASRREMNDPIQASRRKIHSWSPLKGTENIKSSWKDLSCGPGILGPGILIPGIREFQRRTVFISYFF